MIKYHLQKILILIFAFSVATDVQAFGLRRKGTLKNESRLKKIDKYVITKNRSKQIKKTYKPIKQHKNTYTIYKNRNINRVNARNQYKRNGISDSNFFYNIYGMRSSYFDSAPALTSHTSSSEVLLNATEKDSGYSLLNIGLGAEIGINILKPTEHGFFISSSLFYERLLNTGNEYLYSSDITDINLTSAEIGKTIISGTTTGMTDLNINLESMMGLRNRIGFKLQNNVSIYGILEYNYAQLGVTADNYGTREFSDRNTIRDKYIDADNPVIDGVTYQTSGTFDAAKTATTANPTLLQAFEDYDTILTQKIDDTLNLTDISLNSFADENINIGSIGYGLGISKEIGNRLAFFVEMSFTSFDSIQYNSIFPLLSVADVNFTTGVDGAVNHSVTIDIGREYYNLVESGHFNLIDVGNYVKFKAGVSFGV